MKIHSPAMTRAAKCDAHGEYQSRCYYANTWLGCPVCAADHAAIERAKVETKESEQRLAAWQRRIGGAAIPERFHDRRLETYVATTAAQRRALAFAKEYADNFDTVLKTGRSALFIGRPGTGKTHLAVGIGLQIMARSNRTVLFTTVMRALRRVKDTWNKASAESETKAVAALASPDFLILDEVGLQFGSETERMLLFDVLNDRYEKRRPTLLMSNLPMNDIREYLGERIMDRLREDGGEFIPFDWESHRAQR